MGNRKSKERIPGTITWSKDIENAEIFINSMDNCWIDITDLRNEIYQGSSQKLICHIETGLTKEIRMNIRDGIKYFVSLQLQAYIDKSGLKSLRVNPDAGIHLDAPELRISQDPDMCERIPLCCPDRYYLVE